MEIKIRESKSEKELREVQGEIDRIQEKKANWLSENKGFWIDCFEFVSSIGNSFDEGGFRCLAYASTGNFDPESDYFITTNHIVIRLNDKKVVDIYYEEHTKEVSEGFFIPGDWMDSFSVFIQKNKEIKLAHLLTEKKKELSLLKEIFGEALNGCE